jgi:SAM-dependent methyltransferase
MSGRTDLAIRAQPTPTADRRRLVLLSFLMLFVELALIRWLGANIIYLSFFSNLVLLGSFLGIGLGFLSADRGKQWSRYFPWTLFLLVAVVTAFPVEIDRIDPQVLFFGDPQPTGFPIWVIIPLVFGLVVMTLATIAQAVAQVFATFPPLEAYRLDIGGSLLGIAGFTAVSFLRAPPVAWGLIVVVVAVASMPALRRIDRWALGGLAAVLGLQSVAPGLSWSAYYQIDVYEVGGVQNISVNGVHHQGMFPVATLAGSVYSQPYDFLDQAPTRVLVIGAGSGNDVAMALAKGASQVDAVEIDRRLYEIGVELHPDRPYQDPRVDVIIDDGRAFMEQSEASYDMIVFALPDSLTLVSGQANLRLESYLFTQEALTEARRLLAPGGVFAMYNFYREEWLIQRLARTVAEAFDDQPCVISVGGEGRLALIASGGTTDTSCPSEPFNFIGPRPVTDDYPFLYLREKSIPGLYVTTLLALLAISIVVVKAGGGRIARLRPYADLFAMGAAFLLLETKSVVQFALWFGTTWIVNSLVFAGILLSVWGAVEIARRTRLPRQSLLFMLLFAFLALAWGIPPSALLDLPLAVRVPAAAALTFAPILFANLIFAKRFADTASSTVAFGANLLGAMVGGLIEYAALLVGYRALMIPVGVLYLAAFWLTPGTIDR